MIRKPACVVREGEGRRRGGALHNTIHVDTCVHTCVVKVNMYMKYEKGGGAVHNTIQFWTAGAPIIPWGLG